MGVKGLLQALQGIQQKSHVREFRGKRLAIDGFAWLHRGAFSSALDIVKGNRTQQPINYVIKRIGILLVSGVIPVVIFDGLSLGSKSKTNENRRKTREENKSKALKLIQEDRESDAFKLAGAAVEISSEMVRDMTRELNKRNIRYLIAPYEADAQLGYLSHHKIVDGVLSEDSDLLLYGCETVLYKLQDDGSCLKISRSDISNSNILPPHVYSEDNLIVLCSLAGCDYTEGVSGVGLKKGVKFVSRVPLLSDYEYSDNTENWFGRADDNLPSSPSSRLKLLTNEIRDSGFHVPEGYDLELRRSLWTYKHQTVYDPMKFKLTRRYPLPPAVEEICRMRHHPLLRKGNDETEIRKSLRHFFKIEVEEENDIIENIINKHIELIDALGWILPDNIAKQVCEGDLDPRTLRPFECTPSASVPVMSDESEIAKGTLSTLSDPTHNKECRQEEDKDKDTDKDNDKDKDAKVNFWAKERKGLIQTTLVGAPAAKKDSAVTIIGSRRRKKSDQPEMNTSRDKIIAEKMIQDEIIPSESLTKTILVKSSVLVSSESEQVCIDDRNKFSKKRKIYSRENSPVILISPDHRPVDVKSVSDFMDTYKIQSTNPPSLSSSSLSTETGELVTEIKRKEAAVDKGSEKSAMEWMQKQQRTVRVGLQSKVKKMIEEETGKVKQKNKEREESDREFTNGIKNKSDWFFDKYVKNNEEEMTTQKMDRQKLQIDEPSSSLQPYDEITKTSQPIPKRKEDRISMTKAAAAFLASADDDLVYVDSIRNTEKDPQRDFFQNQEMFGTDTDRHADTSGRSDSKNKNKNKVVKRDTILTIQEQPRRSSLEGEILGRPNDSTITSIELLNLFCANNNEPTSSRRRLK